MSAIDFQLAFGRLLRDGRLRDRFASEPALAASLLGVTAASAEILRALNGADLEFQARVLLRKRSELVQRLMPRTFAALDVRAWPVFLAYARTFWPEEPNAALRDAAGFCRHLERTEPGVLSDTERNRMRFALTRGRLAIHFVRDLPIRGRLRRGLQTLLRLRGDRLDERGLYLGL